MNTRKVLSSSSVHLRKLAGHVFDSVTISQPTSLAATVNLAKTISKLSPFLSNLIEFHIVEILNEQSEHRTLGKWHRQDPGFPDAIFSGSISPTPGFEIKSWFPLSTEITARFRDSSNKFLEDQTYVCILAWLPEQLIFGRPQIIDVCVVSGKSVAQARNRHYHKPPDYVVIEPEDTSDRTRNLRQSNTSGHKFQGTAAQYKLAESLVNDWGENGSNYQTDAENQAQFRQLLSAFPYRFDTNFAKIDRIVHGEIEDFKRRVLRRSIMGKNIREWAHLLRRGTTEQTQRALEGFVVN